MGLNSPDVLLVGGIFGSLGYAVAAAAGMLGNIGNFPLDKMDPAFSIVVTAIVVRLVFGKTGVFGKVRAGDNRWLPSDVAGWLPWQYKPAMIILISVAWGSADRFLHPYNARTVSQPGLASPPSPSFSWGLVQSSPFSTTWVFLPEWQPLSVAAISGGAWPLGYSLVSWANYSLCYSCITVTPILTRQPHLWH